MATVIIIIVIVVTRFMVLVLVDHALLHDDPFLRRMAGALADCRTRGRPGPRADNRAAGAANFTPYRRAGRPADRASHNFIAAFIEVRAASQRCTYQQSKRSVLEHCR
ncbi:MAG TPA: hypothetical protein VET30_11375, partial [Pseudoxanthomonas sp.]|nr:hypothetical protein [Pseudoxanthomonas sp.]